MTRRFAPPASHRAPKTKSVWHMADSMWLELRGVP